jgi:nitroreductase
VSAPDAASPPVAVGEDAPIFQVMSTLRAMRRLKPDPVPDELLERLAQAAVWAPNGATRQAMEFVVVTDRALMARLAQLWGRSVDAHLNSLGRVTPATQDERVVRAAQYQREHFHETPALIVACYRKLRMDARTAYRMHSGFAPAQALRLFARGPRINVISEASSVYPGVQNLLLAARALGDHEGTRPQLPPVHGGRGPRPAVTQPGRSRRRTRVRGRRPGGDIRDALAVPDQAHQAACGVDRRGRLRDPSEFPRRRGHAGGCPRRRVGGRDAPLPRAARAHSAVLTPGE